MSDSSHYTQLRIHERVYIEIRLRDGVTLTSIATELGRSPSTISKEVARNGGSCYLAEKAQVRADARPHRGLLLDERDDLASAIITHLKNHRSVIQALAIVARQHPGWQPVSHESVYHWIFNSVKYKAAKLWKLLVRKRTNRRKRHLDQERRGRIKNMTMIDQRPFVPEDRTELGHWEGDLVVGAGGKSAVATLVERKTRVTSVLHVSSKRAQDVTDALVAWFEGQPSGSVTTLTWDGGKELAYHEQFTAVTGVKVYFAEPHSPWQRGTNENTNGVLRRKIPKGTDLSWVDQATADEFSTWLNERPMPTLSWSTPNEALERELVALGS